MTASCVARHRGIGVVALDVSPARVARARAARVLSGGVLPLDVLFPDAIALAEIPDDDPKLLQREAFKAVVGIGDGRVAEPA